MSTRPSDSPMPVYSVATARVLTTIQRAGGYELRVAIVTRQGRPPILSLAAYGPEGHCRSRVELSERECDAVTAAIEELTS